ncbi:MAG TPA: DUF6328 family protein [Patescibacteria group bacterium]|nr:DUF6328 family protein [Patescibacteria group bacterium]
MSEETRDFPPGPGPREPESLSSSVSHVLEEARLLIPGAQAFIGFQLVVVFNSRFGEVLDRNEQTVHLVAMACAITAMTLLMTPALYHREAESGWISRGFVNLSTKILGAATPLLGASVALDFYLIARVITLDRAVALASAAAIAFVIVFLWFLLPRIDPLRDLLRRS